MDRWLAISDGAAAALHALALAASAPGPLSARQAAERLGVSPTYLAKLIQDLDEAGLVAVSRGATGGFALARDPASITVLEALRPIDEPPRSRYCLFPESRCRTGTCRLKELCDEVALKAESTLGAMTVAELAHSY